MAPVTCTEDDCDEPVRQEPATEMPTLEGEGTRTTFDVRFCDAGHILEYRDKTEPAAPNQ